MRRLPLRFTGILLIVAAGLGAVLSIAGTILLWRFEPAAESTVVETLDLFDHTLTTTRDFLKVSSQTLVEVDTNFTQVETSLEDASAALKSTSLAAAGLAKLAGSDLPGVVGDTQTALQSMQKSAKFMDDTLKIVSLIPFVGANYRPDVPLQDSIGQVSKSLDGVGPDLAAMQSQLQSTSADFAALQADTERLAKDIGEIKTNLSNAEKLVSDYQQILDESQQRLDSIRSRAVGWMRAAAWMATVFMVWLLLAQFGLFTQGLELLTRKFVALEQDSQPDEPGPDDQI